MGHREWYELPWLVNITGDNEATYTRDQIKYIEFVGDLYIVNPEYWFAGLENLISADLTHMKIELAGSSKVSSARCYRIA